MRHLNLKPLWCCALLVSSLLAQNGARFTQTNLVSDVPGLAARTNANLVNAWGIASSGIGPWWVNAAGTAHSLVLDAAGIPFPAATPLIVAVPPTEPTGIVFNASPDFLLAPGQKAILLFASTAGTIAGWNPNVNSGASAMVKVTTPGAAYTGLTIGQISGKNVIYAANFSGGVDVFDASFAPMTTLPAGAFHDPEIPAGYAPFNVENIGGSIFVAFAKVGDDGDEEAGPGLGYVDQFTPDGRLLLRLEHGDWLNAPWGMVAVPQTFGPFGGSILVGQFGSGQIAAFNPQNGKFRGLALRPDKEPIEIEGLWGIRFGNGGAAGSPLELYFAAGIDDEEHGLFGKLTLANGQTDR